MKTQIRMITLATSALLPLLTSLANAGVVAADGAVPSSLTTAGTDNY